MVMYGLAFDFFNVAASIYVDKSITPERRALGQGMLLMMTNGFGASAGMIAVQYVINGFTYSENIGGRFYTLGNWNGAWLTFAGFALLLFVLLLFFFKDLVMSENEKEN
jgi:NHS family xanthosine MFS transporter